MNALARLLLLKIVLTLSVWCVPLLLFPAQWLQALGFPVPQPILFLRLLGFAYAALVLGYALGWRAARRGEYPASAVSVGIVSNGGACVLLLFAALDRAWAEWGAVAQAIMWGSLFGTGLISVGLAALGRRHAPVQAPDAPR